MDIPEEYLLADDYVPRNVVIEIATRKAEIEWGEVIPGPVIPMVDEDKEIIAYYVVFTVNGEPFPGYSGALRRIQEGRRLRDTGNRELSERGRMSAWGIDAYRTILVTARYSLKPFPEYFEGLPRFHTMGDYIEGAARQEIGRGARLRHIYFLGRLEQVYEFRNGGSVCYIDPFPIRSIKEEEFLARADAARLSGCEVDGAFLTARREEWNELYNDPPVISNITRVDFYERIPRYLWTGGCAPTAAAMAIGYYDNKHEFPDYAGGYGRLVDYYRAEYKFPCDDSAALRTSIPNNLDEFRVGMNTNCAGGSLLDSVTAGMEYVINTMNQYNFDIIETRNCDSPGDDCYDWCWGEITEQIDDNCPFVWVITCHDCPPGTIRGHALAAYGYNDADQTIAVYNTWDEQEHWWCHDHYGNNCDWFASQTRVHSVRAAGGDFPGDLRLSRPTGGESLHACREDTIRWYQWGNEISQVTIRYSVDSGARWTPDGLIAENYPSAGQGWHEYSWIPRAGIAGTDLRVMVEGKDPYGRMIACEGSFSDFAILADYAVGDVNGSGSYDGLDVTYGVNYFKGGPAPSYECECSPGDIWYVNGDVNGSCSYNGLDITFGVTYFKGGGAPVPCGDCPPD